MLPVSRRSLPHIRFFSTVPRPHHFRSPVDVIASVSRWKAELASQTWKAVEGARFNLERYSSSPVDESDKHGGIRPETDLGPSNVSVPAGLLPSLVASLSRANSEAEYRLDCLRLGGEGGGNEHRLWMQEWGLEEVQSRKHTVTKSDADETLSDRISEELQRSQSLLEEMGRILHSTSDENLSFDLARFVIKSPFALDAYVALAERSLELYERRELEAREGMLDFGADHSTSNWKELEYEQHIKEELVRIKKVLKQKNGAKKFKVVKGDGDGSTMFNLSTLEPRDLLIAEEGPKKFSRTESCPEDWRRNQEGSVAEMFFRTLTGPKGDQIVKGQGSDTATPQELANFVWMMYRLSDLMLDWWDDFYQFHSDTSVKEAEKVKRGKLIRLSDELILEVSQRLFALALVEYRASVVAAQRRIDSYGDKTLRDMLFRRMAMPMGVEEERGEKETSGSLASFSSTKSHTDAVAERRIPDDPNNNPIDNSDCYNSLMSIDFRTTPLRLSQVFEIFGIDYRQRRGRDSLNCPLRNWQKLAMHRPRLLKLRDMRDSCLPSEAFLSSLMGRGEEEEVAGINFTRNQDEPTCKTLLDSTSAGTCKDLLDSGSSTSDASTQLTTSSQLAPSVSAPPALAQMTAKQRLKSQLREQTLLPLKHRDFTSYLELLAGTGRRGYQVYWSREMLDGVFEQVVMASRFHTSRPFCEEVEPVTVLCLGDGMYWKDYLKNRADEANKARTTLAEEIDCAGLHMQLGAGNQNAALALSLLGDKALSVSSRPTANSKREVRILTSADYLSYLNNSDSGVPESHSVAEPELSGHQLKSLLNWAQPTLILCSHMPKGDLSTHCCNEFRRTPSLQEYVLVGPRDSDRLGSLWETWGKRKLFMDSRFYKKRKDKRDDSNPSESDDLPPPYKLDGFARRENVGLSKLLLMSDDRPGMVGFGYVTHFVRL